MVKTPSRFLPSRRRALGLLGAAAATLTLPGAATAQNHRFGILGQQAPLISGSYWIDGAGEPTTFDMSETAGRWVFLKCWQSWCPGCHRHGFPAFQKMAEAFGDDDRVALIGMQTVFEGFSTNTESKLREMQLRYSLEVKMGHDAGDPDGDHRPSTMRRYRTGGTPWIVVVDPSGQVVFNDYHINADRLIEYLGERLQVG